MTPAAENKSERVGSRGSGGKLTLTPAAENKGLQLTPASKAPRVAVAKRPAREGELPVAPCPYRDIRETVRDRDGSPPPRLEYRFG